MTAWDGFWVEVRAPAQGRIASRGGGDAGRWRIASRSALWNSDVRTRPAVGGVCDHAHPDCFEGIEHAMFPACIHVMTRVREYGARPRSTARPEPGDQLGVRPVALVLNGVEREISATDRADAVDAEQGAVDDDDRPAAGDLDGRGQG